MSPGRAVRARPGRRRAAGTRARRLTCRPPLPCSAAGQPDRVNLAGADLTGADLTGADLTGAVLAGADLADVNLFQTSLAGADLGGADLTIRRRRFKSGEIWGRWRLVGSGF